MKKQMILGTIALAMSATIGIACFLISYPKYVNESDQFQQIAFSREKWISSVPKSSGQTPRGQMRDAVIHLFPLGTQKDKVLDILGPPRNQGLPKEFSNGSEERLPEGKFFIVYNIAISPSGYFDDLVFAFDQQGRLLKISEGVNLM